ncbi:MAG: efflux RND transporter permease subunit [Lachnospiraceae bacterium]|nr:efflux RND transporter permease subunit [Lachnospiraceae bacterium]
MSKFSVKKPYTVLVGVILVIVLGIVSFMKTTTDLLPSISLPYVIVVTTYPGASPETVEMTVTQPVEAGMATVSNIESISSVSSENYSMVILEFAQSANMDSVSLEIREKLDQIKSYWNDSVGNPMIMKLNPDMLPVMIAAVGVEGMDDAQISSYVQNEIMPELESIEGVASASATGLLEKSVHVVIRQEKVDEVNARIRAAIDEKMKDAEEELAEGRKKIEDGQKELADGKKEIQDGKKGLEDGKKELEDGKKQLSDKQEETLNSLAQTKAALTTGKTQLEATKVTITMISGVIDPLIKRLDEMEKEMLKNREDAQKQLEEALGQQENTNLRGPVPGADLPTTEASAGESDGQEGTDAQQPAEADDKQGTAVSAPGEAGQNSQPAESGRNYSEELKQLRESILKNQWLQDAAKDNARLRDALDRLEKLEETEEDFTLLSELKKTLKTFREEMDDKSEMVEENLKKVNQGLEAVEKGELTAAIEFANASTGITVGEYKMEVAKSQIEAAEEKIKSGQEQMEEALKQLEEGQKQLEEARENAYEQADMKNVLTVSTIEGLLTAQNFSMPAGYVTEEGIDYLIRVGDKPDSVEELQKMPLIDMHMEGMDAITLGEVADVFYADNSDAIYTNVNGNAGVILSLQKQTGYSTGNVSDLLKARFDKMMKENPDLHIIRLMDQGIYIDLVMDSIFNNILFGAGLAILILILFLKDLRPTMIVAFSIPVSLVTAIVCMYFSNVTLNVISLSGLALGIGMLVDNSIVVIENIYRLRKEGATMIEAAVKGAGEVAGAIAASTLTTVCVFLPIVFTEGITRQLFVDMGLTIAYSLFASLIVALTVVPAMASKMLTKTKEQKDGRLFSAMAGGYEKLLAASLKAKPLVFLLVIGLLGVSIYAALSKGTAFMPEMDSTQMTVNIEMNDPASTLADTAGLTNEVMEMVRGMEGVTDAGAMTSSSNSIMGMFGAGGSDKATTIYVVTDENKKLSNQQLAAQILEETKDLPAKITVETSEMDMSALGGSGITIQVRGRDLDTLRRIASEVAAIVESVEGTANVSDGLAESSTELRIHVIKEEAVKYGLTVAQVFQQIMEKVAEANASTVLSGNDQDYSVYVSNDADLELTRELLKQIEVTGTDENRANVKVALADIAEFEDARSLDSINRVDQNRYIAVTAQIADGYNVGLVSRALEDKMAGYEVPEGYRLVYSGENETINDALQQLMLMLLLAVIFMYLIMVAQFQSLLSPFIIMFTIPLAFTGGFFGLYFADCEVSVVAMIGFVMLAGIIVNNGIVLIDYMNQLRAGGMERREAILTAGRTRLRPVLMTALTTILALSTMAFSNDMGAAMSKPMAVVTIGGLLYGTLLTLVVIPCVYDVFARRRSGKKKERQPEMQLTEFESENDPEQVRYSSLEEPENAPELPDDAGADETWKEEKEEP